ARSEVVVRRQKSCRSVQLADTDQRLERIRPGRGVTRKEMAHPDERLGQSVKRRPGGGEVAGGQFRSTKRRDEYRFCVLVLHRTCKSQPLLCRRPSALEVTNISKQPGDEGSGES